MTIFFILAIHRVLPSSSLSIDENLIHPGYTSGASFFIFVSIDDNLIHPGYTSGASFFIFEY